jgi:triacylglycerol lipase
MGGLDARYAISRLGLHGRVASLTTIGTPHRGTPLADSSAWLLGDFQALRRALAVVGVDGVYDLTTKRMNDFNRLVVDSADVSYASVVGAVRPGRSVVHAMLTPGHAYLLRKSGVNDGIVPAQSQPWGDVIDEVEADHWAQIGWSGGFDAQAFYARLVEHLAGRGL